MIFENRFDAALQLIPLLEKYQNEKGVILAIPRGGVPIGYHIAKKFHFPLELLLTKKIGHPLNKEFAIGAVSLGGQIVDSKYKVDDEYIANEIKRTRKSLWDRYRKFMGDRNPIDLKDKLVIIVDDGIATGITMMAAIDMIRQQMPRKIVVAVPVASVEAANKIKEAVDDFICLATPEDFMAVGQYYYNFAQVSDAEVIELLKEIQQFPRPA
jgi:predicted phosphoribosyltransferase